MCSGTFRHLLLASAVLPLLLPLFPLVTVSTTATAASVASHYSQGIGSSFDEMAFRRRIQNALSSVERILEGTRTPTRLASDVTSHTYDDKYGLTEFITNVAIAATLNTLERMGLDGSSDEFSGIFPESMATKEGRSSKKIVVLRFTANETTEFVQERTVDVQRGPRRVEVTEEIILPGDDKSGGEGGKTKTERKETKVVTKVKEYDWTFRVAFTIEIIVRGKNDDGEDDDRNILLQSHEFRSNLTVSGGDKRSPQTGRRNNKNNPIQQVDVSLSNILDHVQLDDDDDDGDAGGHHQPTTTFRINRSESRTPRRNEDVESMAESFHQLNVWSQSVSSYLRDCVQLVNRLKVTSDDDSSSSVDLVDLFLDSQESAFVPVLPLMQEPEQKKMTTGNETTHAPINGGSSINSNGNNNTSSVLLGPGSANILLSEQRRSLDLHLVAIKERCFSTNDGCDGGIVYSPVASLSFLANHMLDIGEQYFGSIDFVEHMLRAQLVKAIGKEIQPSDFQSFMSFHFRKLFGAPYAPKPFCLTIRRPDHAPDGTITLLGHMGSEAPQPIETLSRKFDVAPPMFMQINSATSVEMTGDRYLHAWIAPDFGDDVHGLLRGLHGASSSSPSAYGPFRKVEILARARPFSGFLLVLGKISGPQSFTPEHAMVLQNRDEVLLPILLEKLPTAKEFRDATVSLSPEQKRFAQAFRSMQLESSVFGLCIIQLKPQLEMLLGLPEDSLTKEIQLTQDLLELFVDYGIPSDLVTFDGDESMTTEDKVGIVRTYVAAVIDMITSAKEKQLKDAKEKMEMRRRQMKYHGSEEPEVMMAATSGMNLMAFDEEEGQEMSRGAPRGQARMDATSTPRRLANQYERSRVRAPSFEDMEHMPTSADSQSREEVLTTTHRVDMTAHDETDNSRIDFTMIPKRLEDALQLVDGGASMRPSIIRIGSPWTKTFHKTLLSKADESLLGEEAQRTEKNKAFDLLDALSRSGTLPLPFAELHVITTAVHSFAKSLVLTVIQDDVDPIVKLESSVLAVASTIHDTSVDKLIKDDHLLERLAVSLPQRLLHGTDNDDATVTAAGTDGVSSTK